jgi:putative flippase GtrA
VNREPTKLSGQLSIQLLFFGCVGALGFVVDAGLFWVFYKVLHLDLVTARSLAFFPATLVTWMLNRTLTFSSKLPSPLGHEYFRYFAVQAVGIGINFLVFYILVSLVTVATRLPLIPLACGSVAAMIFNFLGARHFVYGR